MKRTIILLLCVSSLSLMMAQDIIVTTDAEEIQAKVFHVSENEVSYLKWNNQDGPTYSISVDHIFYIKYANGQKDVFTTNHQPKLSNVVLPPTNYITQDGNTYSYENKIMKHEEYEKFLYKNCQEAYQQYRKGKTISHLGWGFLILGCSLDIIGTSLFYGVDKQNPAGPFFVCIGGAFELACIPTLIVGYHKMHDSADIFNQQCATKKHSTAYWSINADAKGIGLALNF